MPGDSRGDHGRAHGTLSTGVTLRLATEPRAVRRLRAADRRVRSCHRSARPDPHPCPARPRSATRSARRAGTACRPAFDVRTVLHHLTGGVDLTQIDGIGAYTALKLIAEIGTDMRRWPTAQHFTSWLTLAPKN